MSLVIPRQPPPLHGSEPSTAFLQGASPDSHFGCVEGAALRSGRLSVPVDVTCVRCARIGYLTRCSGRRLCPILCPVAACIRLYSSEHYSLNPHEYSSMQSYANAAKLLICREVIPPEHSFRGNPQLDLCFSSNPQTCGFALGTK